MSIRRQHGEADIRVIGWVLLVVVFLWQLYKGFFVQEIGFGPFTLKFGRDLAADVSRSQPSPQQPHPIPTTPAVPSAQPTPEVLVHQFSLTGTWSYTARSSLHDALCTQSMLLTMDGDRVSGVMNPCDGSKNGVVGTFNGNTLELSRDTGVANTIQRFRLMKRSDDRLAGEYWNDGAAKDKGTIELQR